MSAGLNNLNVNMLSGEQVEFIKKDIKFNLLGLLYPKYVVEYPKYVKDAEGVTANGTFTYLMNLDGVERSIDVTVNITLQRRSKDSKKKVYQDLTHYYPLIELIQVRDTPQDTVETEFLNDWDW